MSKSDPDPNGAVYLLDTDDQILKKIKRAVTDSGSEISFDEEAKPGVANLLTIQSVLTGEPIEKRVKAYAGKQYGHLKVETAEQVVEALRPIREKINEMMKDKAELDKVLKAGAERASARAETVLRRTYDRIGFIRSCLI